MRCVLCNGDQVRQIFEKRGNPYHRCIACGFVFSRPCGNPNIASTLDDYEPAYLRYLDESVEDERNHLALLRWIEQFRAVNGRSVLDIGCGSGKFVRFLLNAKAEACGIEPSEPLFSRFLIDDPFFVCQTLGEYANGSKPERFELIFACDVIEHVERPDHFLRDAAMLLRSGGILFVSTPDVGSIPASCFGKGWHYFNRYHLSYLSRKTIGVTAGRFGLREVGYARLPRWKSVGYVLQYTGDFVIGRSRMRIPDRLNGLIIPMNLFDTMTIAFEKEGERV